MCLFSSIDDKLTISLWLHDYRLFLHKQRKRHLKFFILKFSRTITLNLLGNYIVEAQSQHCLKILMKIGWRNENEGADESVL